MGPTTFIAAASQRLYHNRPFRGTWVAQSVEPPTLAQVMISQLVSLSPALGCLLSAQSLLWILCLPLSLLLTHSHSFSQKQTNIKKQKRTGLSELLTYSCCEQFLLRNLTDCNRIEIVHDYELYFLGLSPNFKIYFKRVVWVPLKYISKHINSVLVASQCYHLTFGNIRGMTGWSSGLQSQVLDLSWLLQCDLSHIV